MSFSFTPRHGLIVIGAELNGPNGSAILRLALDTGATSTLVNVAMLVAIGCDPALAADRVQQRNSVMKCERNMIFRSCRAAFEANIIAGRRLGRTWC